MNRLKNKLQNTRGASMIIALVFMLICLFVGGSVLVAATMNTKRIEHEDKYQVFLDRRSAASLISDELKTDDRDPLRLVIHKIEKRKITRKYENGKLPTDPIPEGTPAEVSYRFEVYGGNDPLKGLKKLVIGSAIRNYEMEGHALEHPATIDIIYNQTVKDHAGNDVVETAVSHDVNALMVEKPVSGKRPNGLVDVAIRTNDPDVVKLSPENSTYTIEFRMDDKSNFIVGFYYPEGENPTNTNLLEVRLYGSKAASAGSSVVNEYEIPDKEGDICTRIETTTTTSSIIWDDPVVRKGGLKS